MAGGLARSEIAFLIPLRFAQAAPPLGSFSLTECLQQAIGIVFRDHEVTVKILLRFLVERN